MAEPRKVVVLMGVGDGTSLGGALARAFSKADYSLALIARRADFLREFSDQLNSAGGDATPFPAESYSAENINAVWNAIRAKYTAPNYIINVAIFNVVQGFWKPFLDVTPENIRQAMEVNVEAAFAFAREVILTFKENEIMEPIGKRGTLIFSGATASIRGNLITSAFAAGKHGIRALAQSLGKEFNKENIHVAHVLVDGPIRSPYILGRYPYLVGKPDLSLTGEGIAESYLFLANQGRTAWTNELDLRSAHEPW